MDAVKNSQKARIRFIHAIKFMMNALAMKALVNRRTSTSENTVQVRGSKTPDE